MPEDMSQYKDDFINETKEHLQILNTSLLKLEKNSNDKESIDAIFRGAHTIKSMAAAMGFMQVSELCHTAEDLLDTVKKGQTKLTPDIVKLLFNFFDTLEDAVKLIKEDKPEPDLKQLIDKLKTLSASSPKGEKTPKKEETETLSGADLAKKPEKIEKIDNIRVDVKRLDLLMNLIEELLVNKMSLDQIQENKDYDEFPTALATLGRLVSDLQFNIMEARMVPVNQVFNRFPRMVRDLAISQKKEVNFVVKGGDIELDRTIIDQIGEPIIHLLRNAIDHGIESPAVREEKKKPKQATVRLTVKREKGFAIITVQDDGNGLDLDKVKEVAIKRGLYSREAVMKLTDEQIKNLLFNPHFSTSEHITKVSGRGVGLDVVRKSIESLGGNIKIDYKPGKGMAVTLELPLTLAIIKALLMQVGTETYAVPLSNVVRSVRVPEQNVKKMLDHEVVLLDKDNVPLIRLHELFNIQQKNQEKGALTVIVRKGDSLAGLGVDSLVSEQEIIIKPMTKFMKKIKGFAGFTILGTGKVVLILDVNNLF